MSQGTHKSLKDNQKAKATVAAIINGTGSLGEIMCIGVYTLLNSNEYNATD